MKRAIYIFVCLILLLGWEISCKDDNNSSNNGKVELFSFGPSGVQLGDTISFVGNNLDKVTQIVFVGDSVSQSSFISQSSTLITLVVPANAKRGNVTLRSPEGDIVSKTPIDFLVKAEILDISTTSGTPLLAKPGSIITISGVHLDWISGITFYNNVNPILVADTDFVSQSASQIEVTVPMTAQTGQLKFYATGTKPMTIITEYNLDIVLPVITNMTPNPVYGGKDQLTITGTDFDLVTGIMLANVPDTIKTFISHTATQIVIAPPAETAPGVVTLYPYSLYPSPSATTLNVVLPAITGLSPNPVARGSQLTISGTNLDLVTKIVMKGVTDPITTFDSQSATQIVITVPQEAIFGQVTVFSLAGVPIVSADALSYVGDTAIDLWTGSLGPIDWSGKMWAPIDVSLLAPGKILGVDFICSAAGKLEIMTGSWWIDFEGYVAIPSPAGNQKPIDPSYTNFEFPITQKDLDNIAMQGSGSQGILFAGDGNIVITKVYVK